MVNRVFGEFAGDKRFDILPDMAFNTELILRE